MRKAPLVVAVLHSNADDKRYQLYCAAYGLEMQIDDEWDAEVVLLAPYEYLGAVTEETDVTGSDTAIVSAGVTDIPLGSNGQPDVSSIQSEQNNWLLVGRPTGADSEATMNAKLQAALREGFRAIVCFSEIGTQQLPSRLAGIDTGWLNRLVIAYVGPGASESPEAIKAEQFVRECLTPWPNAAGEVRFVVGGEMTAQAAAEVTAIHGIDGVLMLDDKYKEWCDILGVLAALHA